MNLAYLHPSAFILNWAGGDEGEKECLQEEIWWQNSEWNR
jgi:hypothetical protein